MQTDFALARPQNARVTLMKSDRTEDTSPRVGHIFCHTDGHEFHGMYVPYLVGPCHLPRTALGPVSAHERAGPMARRQFRSHGVPRRSLLPFSKGCCCCCCGAVPSEPLPAGSLLLVNWRGQSNDPCTGDEPADLFIERSSPWLGRRAQHHEDNYRLDLLSRP